MVPAAKADDTGDDVGACALKPARPIRLQPGQIRLDDLLRVCRTGEQIDHALLNEMLTLFIQENSRRVYAALAAADSGDERELRAAVHALKGSAALIGADHLRDLARDLESHLVSGTPTNQQDAAKGLFDAVHRRGFNAPIHVSRPGCGLSASRMASVNPFERIRSTEGKVFLLLLGLALLMVGFDATNTWMGRSIWFAVVEMVVVLAYVTIGTIGTVRIVARPVRRAVEHFSRISGGDYAKPVLTRRTDEFGDMLRALDQMRISLADAVAARDAAERRYREIVERSVQGFFQTSEDGHVLAANDALAQLLGFASSSALLAEADGLAGRLYVDPTSGPSTSGSSICMSR